MQRAARKFHLTAWLSGRHHDGQPLASAQAQPLAAPVPEKVGVPLLGLRPISDHGPSWPLGAWQNRSKRLALQVRDYDLRNLGKAHPTVVGNPLPWRKMRRRRRRVGEQAVGATKCHKTSNKLEPKWLGSSVQGVKMTMTV